MALKGIFIDANLLVLLVVGATDRALIAKHRRLKRFAVEDYERLIELSWSRWIWSYLWQLLRKVR